MAQDTIARSALERKLNNRFQAADKPRSLLRAMRLALARTADDLIQLPLAVIGATQRLCSQDTLGQTVEDGRLFLLFATQDELLAAACLDLQCVASVIQQQTMGQVSKGDAEGRPYTGTDAAMSAPLIEGMLSRAAGLVERPADRACVEGFEYLSYVPDRHGLVLSLEREDYRIIDLTVDIAAGRRQGKIQLVLPDPGEVSEPGDRATVEPDAKLDRAVEVISADLNVVIGQLRLPLSSLSALKGGDVLPLTGARLDRTELQTIDQKKVAICRLGQRNGMRAVRLNETGAEDRASLSPARSFETHEISSATGGTRHTGAPVVEHPEDARTENLPANVARVQSTQVPGAG